MHGINEGRVSRDSRFVLPDRCQLVTLGVEVQCRIVVVFGCLSLLVAHAGWMRLRLSLAWSAYRCGRAAARRESAGQAFSYTDTRCARSCFFCGTPPVAIALLRGAAHTCAGESKLTPASRCRASGYWSS